MINKNAKGSRAEALARSNLRADGWLVDFKIRSRFASPDLFGVFDLIAIKDERVLFVQVKTNVSHFYTARKEIAEWMQLNNLEFYPEVWLYLGKKDGWRNSIYDPYSKAWDD